MNARERYELATALGIEDADIRAVSADEIMEAVRGLLKEVDDLNEAFGHLQADLEDIAE
jgi:hypothetical protein